MLTEERALLALMCEYCDSIDRGDLAACARLFERGAWGLDGDLHEGSAAVQAQLDNVTLYDGKPQTRHLMSNVRLMAEEGRSVAEARCCITVMQSVPPDFPLQPIFIGSYHDRFHRHDDTWFFVERRIFPDLVGNMAYHRSDMA